MGRKQRPLDPSSGPVARLAEELRLLRERARLTYGEMETRSKDSSDKPYTKSTFARAASGTSVPSAAVVAEYTRICGGDPERTEKLRRAARTAAGAGGLSAARIGREAKSPWAVADRHDLFTLMKAQRLAAGLPTLRVIQERAAELGTPIGRGTLHDVLTAQRLPTLPLLRAFARACEVPERDLLDWEEAWMRVQAHEKRMPVPAAVARKAFQRESRVRRVRPDWIDAAVEHIAKAGDRSAVESLLTQLLDALDPERGGKQTKRT